MTTAHTPLRWLAAGENFPPVDQAWGANSPAPGLLCAGGDLQVSTLKKAYSKGIFPWYSDGLPVLWWSPAPRMVLNTSEFRLQPSLKKTIKKFSRAADCEIRVDGDFSRVIRACSTSRRGDQDGTWILPEIVDAYVGLHQAGFAHSVEAWREGRLIGGLYFVALGKAVFGESMFHAATDGSKIALAALVAMCRQYQISRIDCQQNTRHLASLGAREMPRHAFVDDLKNQTTQLGPTWLFDPLYWRAITASPTHPE